MKTLPEGPYDFKKTEQKILDFWNSKPFFKPEYTKDKPTFTIILPPPNANGALHLGHMSGYTYQDLMGRYARISGKQVLLLPGKDHAGIQTEVVFEKLLEAKGISKLQMGREEFYKKCYEFCIEMSATTRAQEQRLGLSADYDRELFTLDPRIVKIVLETFINLSDEGWVFKGSKIVNWCVRCQTTLADIDTDHKPRESKLIYIKYPLKDNKDFLVVATTRPETMLGDTALVVNPTDERYKHLIGKTAIVPIVDREIPIISSRRIEKDFGTGVLKLTPAHASDDALIAQEYEDETHIKIPSFNVIWKDGRMVGPIPSRYKKMKVNAARDEIFKELESNGSIEKVEVIQQNVVICERCKSVIEPLMSSQWFVSIEQLKRPAINAVLEKNISILPQNSSKTYIQWMEKLRDWPISRQLWWGYRLPVWYKGHKEELVNDEGEVYETIGGLKVDEHNKDELIKVAINSPGVDWIQDDDVLDTWFSSGQWPFATLMATNDYEKFYPTQIMDTAYDILYFWVSRMVMLGLYRTKKVPFSLVYLNGIVTDKNGQKMSKSKGNGIDPHEMIDKYGTDSLRFSFVMGVGPAQNNSLSEEKLKGFRNFNNKLWNASKYVMSKLITYDSSIEFSKMKDASDIKAIYNIFDVTMFDKSDNEMIEHMHELEVKYNKMMSKSQYGVITNLLYDSFWHTFCDTYLEYTKSDNSNHLIAQSILSYCLKKYLCMLHPFIPFITEEIWQNLVNERQYTQAMMYSFK